MTIERPPSRAARHFTEISAASPRVAALYQADGFELCQPRRGVRAVLVHGSPLSDVESFPPKPGDDDERMLKGVRGKTVVFGHSHLQFKRPGPQGTTLVNPGSAGMPLDGDVRAAYALRHDDGAFEFRRVEYDIERAAQAWDAEPGFGKFAAARIRRGSD